MHIIMYIYTILYIYILRKQNYLILTYTKKYQEN